MASFYYVPDMQCDAACNKWGCIIFIYLLIIIFLIYYKLLEKKSVACPFLDVGNYVLR